MTFPARLTPRVPEHRYSPRLRRHLLQQFQPFRRQRVLERDKALALPPGRAKLATNPKPAGSMTPEKTIGTVRLTRCNANTVGVAQARITSGSSATKFRRVLAQFRVTPVGPARIDA